MRDLRALLLTVASLALLMTMVVQLNAMPPSPELRHRLQQGELSEPYYLQHANEIRARGVDSPDEIVPLSQLLRRGLDTDLNILVIFVDFTDQPSRVDLDYFDDMLFGNHTSTLRDYYLEVSYGNLTLVTVNMPSALGWQRAPQTYDYYVDGQNGFGSYPNNAQRLAEDAVNLVDPVVDFSNYDNDGDGDVDGLFIAHSGQGAEMTGSSDDIWSHAWVMSSRQWLDGVECYRYSMEPEYWSRPPDMTIGVYAHEMGHAVFGLPDLYDGDYDSQGLGTWTLMAGGSWNGRSGDSPAHPDAWCKYRMGFATLINVTDNIAGARIRVSQYFPDIYRLWTNGAAGPQYFLVENRRRTGYDTPLPAAGLLIYHVDDTRSGNNNQWYPGHYDQGHYKVALEQADGRWDLERNASGGDNGDPYPGSTNNRTFDGNSTPNSDSYSFSSTHVAVRNISNAADTMTADLFIRIAENDPLYVSLPDTSVARNGQLCVPIRIEDVGTRSITVFDIAIAFDPTLLSMTAPYYNTEGRLADGWAITADFDSLAGMIHVFGYSSSALEGDGQLLCLPFRGRPDAPVGSTSPLTFTACTFNSGSPPAATTDGSLEIISVSLSISPAAIDFDTVEVGRFAQRLVNFTNDGTVPVSVDFISEIEPFTTNFTGPQVLEAGQRISVRVRFEPPAGQFYLDTLWVWTTAPGSPHPIAVQGWGSVPQDVQTMNHEPLPTEFYLTQNYPNPFNPTTTIEFGVPAASHVTIRVVDVEGRLVEVLADEMLPAGVHRVNWYAGRFAAGIYFAEFRASDHVVIRKMMLMK